MRETIDYTPYKLRDWKKFNCVEWKLLSKNSNAIHLLEQHQNKIDWMFLSENPNKSSRNSPEHGAPQTMYSLIPHQTLVSKSSNSFRSSPDIFCLIPFL